MKQSTLTKTLIKTNATMCPIRSAVTSEVRMALLCLTAAACGFPRPPDVAGATPGGSDGSVGSVVAIQVSPSGDDANDGLVLPVKTLKHALGLAGENSQVSQIILATGTYSISSGETFPYIVPPNVEIIGPAGGGAVLVGSGAGPGMSVDTGGLQDVDLQDFSTAITATGGVTLRNIRVLNSEIAIQAETAADVTVNNLDITGMSGSCATGIVLNGGAKFTAMTLATRSLGMTLNAKDRSAVNLSRTTVLGDMSCSKVFNLMSVVSSASFILSDSLLDGGPNHGIGVEATSSEFRAMISNTIVRNLRLDALGGVSDSAGSSFKMVGGELSNNGNAGAELRTGVWSFSNVTIRQNKTLAIYIQDGSLIMRDCSIVNNGDGIDIFDSAHGDFGTPTDLGGNTFQGNAGPGVIADGNFGATLVTAVGNTWNPNIQGADANGQYTTTATVPGPVTSVNGGNFGLGGGWSLLR